MTLVGVTSISIGSCLIVAWRVCVLELALYFFLDDREESQRVRQRESDREEEEITVNSRQH